MVFYRKYRPQNLAEIDKEEIRRRLSFILASPKAIPHAFLFTGPKGTGKTSAARILAKAVNCLKRTTSEVDGTPPKERGGTPASPAGGSEVKGIEPCNHCFQCLSITNGTNLDVLEIDAASNRGIDEIRELRDKIKLAPASAHYKVYIIDEVHMLTTEAANALLKTLEEPPAHAIFVLATTEPQKLPETIISRCLRFNFGRATREEIVRALQRVISGENIKLKESVLELIADFADGSFRDAQKILEEAVFENLTTDEEIRKLLGLTAPPLLQKILRSLFRKDAKEALETVLSAYNEGANIKNLNEGVLEALHNLLLDKCGVAAIPDRLSLLEVDKISSLEIRQLINLFSKAYQELKIASVPTLPLELAIIEWCEGKEG